MKNDRNGYLFKSNFAIAFFIIEEKKEMSTIKTVLQSVAPEYKHYDKFAEPDEMFGLKNSTLKWYNLAKQNEPVPDEVNKLARTFLTKESESGSLKDLGELGFVILHRCGADFYFLLVNSWRNGNELWESVYAKNGEAQEGFAPFVFENLHRGTFCVWELAVVWHEKHAWEHFLLSAKIEIDETKYLQNKYRGKA